MMKRDTKMSGQNQNSKSISMVLDQIERNTGKALRDLRRLVSQPSVSAKGEGLHECALLVRELLEDLGASPMIYKIESAAPIVCGEIKSRSNPDKTVLFYNHYDVQPPEPIERWDSPPFKVVERKGKIYGRGISDDKGELVGRVWAAKSFIETNGDVPCNLKFLIEGEEEIGSSHLHKYKERFPHAFSADAVIWEFGGVDERDRPVVTLGVKGMLYVELKMTNANSDAHSRLAAIVENPAWKLVDALETMKSKDKVAIPGWYDDVVPLSKQELALIETSPFDEAQVKNNLGIRQFVDNMHGFELKKALVGNSTFNIAGLYSGYIGKGPKTILPSQAVAKIDFRLVPNQDPDDLLKKMKMFLKRNGYSDIEVTCHEAVKPKRTSPHDPIVSAATQSAKRIHGKTPVLALSSPATGPMAVFNAPCVAIGGSHPDSKNHSPNENMRIDLFVKAMKWVADAVNRYST